MRKSRFISYVAVLLAVACTDQPSPTSPLISADFQDAIHGGGNPHFYLLPPVISQPNLANERFLGGLAPDVRVRIREMARAGAAFVKCTNEAIDYITATEKPKLQIYGLAWFAGAKKYGTKVAAPCVYRLTVEVGGTASQPGLVLGYADVQLLNRKTLKNIISGDYIRLLEDWVLPFWFFIGEGAISASTNPGGTPCTPTLDCKEAIVRAKATVTQTIVSPEATAGVSLPPASLVEDGVLRITKKVPAGPSPVSPGPECIPRSKMAVPQFRDCYDFEFFPLDGTAPENVFKAPATVAMCVELEVLTPAQQAHRDLLQIFFFHPQTNRLDVLENASAAFLPCEGGIIGGSSDGIRGFAGVLQRGWHAAVSGLRALVAPAPLFASSAVIHVGVGGRVCTERTSCKLSTGTWGFPAELSIEDGDEQSAPVGTEVETPPSVLLTDTLGAPLEGAIVTFSVLFGGGSVTGAIDTTDIDGIATVGSWTLGTTPGDNFLMAKVAGATPDSVIVTATGAAAPAGPPVIDQSHADAAANLSANINECCRYVAQTFTAGVTGSLVGVNISVFPNSGAPPLNVAIRSTSDGVPTSVILGETTVPSGGSSISDLITFPQAITLTSGVQYAIVVHYPSAPPPGAGQGRGSWGGTTGNLYTAGVLLHSVDGTSWFEIGTGPDGHFRTHMSP